MHKIAIIGTRDLTNTHVDRLDKLIAIIGSYSPKDYIIATGAAKGIDQYGAELTRIKGFSVILYIPWSTYEEQWVSNMVINGENKIAKVVYNPHKDIEAYNSVISNHPNPSALSRGATALHARNYLIIKDCIKVIALPKFVSGKPSGGTAQGIRLCESMGINVQVI